MSERNCGECLMNDVEIVPLDRNGVCPRCHTYYGPENPANLIEKKGKTFDVIAKTNEGFRRS